ncbi:putative dehydrogenase [Mycena filopes]|nr:putative dehydrogenase [Mycena filopes]
MQRALRFNSTGPFAIVLSAPAINISDVMNVEGRFPITTTPRTPGRDFAGVVATGAHAGKRVWGTGGNHGFDSDGTHAQFISVPESALKYMEMPGNLSFEQAASVGVPYLTAWTMIERAALEKGQYVLVLGSSGAVGSAAVQIARLKGAIPIESARRPVEGAVDVTGDIRAQVLEKTGGRGISAVVDAVGDGALFKKALEALGSFGRYVIISVGQTPGGQFTFDALDFYRFNKTLIGVNTLSYTFEESVRILSELRTGFEKGVLQPNPTLEQVDLADEKAVLKAYADVKGGVRAKQIIVNKETTVGSNM